MCRCWALEGHWCCCCCCCGCVCAEVALSALTWALAALGLDSGGAEAGATLSELKWTLSALK